MCCGCDCGYEVWVCVRKNKHDTHSKGVMWVGGQENKRDTQNKRELWV